MEITRRDYFAAHAMKAVIDRIRSYEMAVEVAVKYADALIAELDKTEDVCTDCPANLIFECAYASTPEQCANHEEAKVQTETSSDKTKEDNSVNTFITKRSNLDD